MNNRSSFPAVFYLVAILVNGASSFLARSAVSPFSRIVNLQDADIDHKYTRTRSRECNGGPLSACIDLQQPKQMSATANPANNGQQQLHFEIAKIESPREYLDFLGRDERLCMITVHAPWCGVCSIFKPLYHHFANQESDKLDLNKNVFVPGRIRFAEMDFDKNENLCRRLGATRLPFVLLYKGNSGMAGQLAGFQCGPNVFQRVVDAANWFLGTPTNPDVVQLLKQTGSTQIHNIQLPSKVNLGAAKR
mmetsp:Transcript_54037/g.80246  ORF Transcript_54037/g.80246 Transcript_54037/m.80246 type:complete len:249 (+) Transcript_54037:50-796(+)|eukprot:CAMPEP_0195525788 /NCGR_PEP_ID=MMETSP0794_2-20130614/26404_1 /TAXON_ID=515487 /ORGANISM="Stephanopyxis turris, Strain CCMP 815" /LENGTH=248 /DNA_ID=CAMNT_0040656321 /DNA_START=50 /DNA_END=796 /DNA_ORIENTATION=+